VEIISDRHVGISPVENVKEEEAARVGMLETA
jgi:hypothetical protein